MIRCVPAPFAGIGRAFWSGKCRLSDTKVVATIDTTFGVGDDSRYNMSARIESVTLGTDADGNETTAPVVVPFKVTPASLTVTIDGGLNLKSTTAKSF